jgi:type III pantothenate kinase
LTAITREGEFLGGNILPGVRLALEALIEKTAKLPSVEIVPVTGAIGRSTVESIQNGVYWSNVGMIRELTRRMTEEAFPDEAPLVIGTGGFSHLFDQESLFDAVVPELSLVGLREALRLNDGG